LAREVAIQGVFFALSRKKPTKEVESFKLSLASTEKRCNPRDTAKHEGIRAFDFNQDPGFT
jgi:hypothetical protein